MTKDELAIKKQETQTRFDELEAQRVNIVTELNVLRGKFQVYEEMEQTLDVFTSDPSTIVAEPKEAKSGK